VVDGRSTQQTTLLLACVVETGRSIKSVNVDMNDPELLLPCTATSCSHLFFGKGKHTNSGIMTRLILFQYGICSTQIKIGLHESDQAVIV
jgi:hypothetical protein